MADDLPILDYRQPPEPRKTTVAVRLLYAAWAMPITLFCLFILVIGVRDAIRGLGWWAMAFGGLLTTVAVKAWVRVFRG